MQVAASMLVPGVFAFRSLRNLNQGPTELVGGSTEQEAVIGRSADFTRGRDGLPVVAGRFN
jgi:hypothetical protein